MSFKMNIRELVNAYVLLVLCLFGGRGASIKMCKMHILVCAYVCKLTNYK